MTVVRVDEMLSAYRVTSQYGKRVDPISGVNSYHSGIDLVKGHKEPIYAFVPGVVIHAQIGITGSGYGGYGNVVVIKDKNCNTHLYAHLDTIGVNVGDIVLAGDIVGTQGATGRVTGSHLHYEVRRDGKLLQHVDPIAYLRQYYEGVIEVDVPKLGNITVKVGNQEIQGIVIDGVSYAPVKPLAEALGKQVSWDANTKVVTVE